MTTPASGHDHDACIAGALTRAADLCARRGARLTDLRREVLELIWQDHTAVKAYDLLGRLGGGEASASAKPPTVYRALDFLLAHGLIHRLESLNAYVGCPDPDHAHEGTFLICDGCGAVIELRLDALDALLERGADALRFAVRRRTVEMRGACATCRGEEGA
jgi:Fur family zinc uptake transcriptional regulator